MEYSIKRLSIASQFIDVDFRLHCESQEKVELRLPTWRPGRYQMANFAQKIRGFSVSFGKKSIAWDKTSHSTWGFMPAESGKYLISYQFYCVQMDAGGCWSDDQQLYLNFSNFCFDVPGKSSEQITISIELPTDYRVASSLPRQAAGSWRARNFQHLIDCPLIASKALIRHSYHLNGTDFHLWFLGAISFDVENLIEVFRKFTRRQIEDFGGFPTNEYNFLIQLLPYEHYHGVEHADSTVLTIGPAKGLMEENLFSKLMRLASHELYHVWNVCRIRPKQLMPYDLSREAYLDSGLILEGVTTYFGDIYLMRSGYLSIGEYLEILTKQIQKEQDSLGWKNQTILESSFDLWLDGYQPGIPHRKVNIYNRGALVSLVLDLMLYDQGSNLARIMASMWTQFGITQTGYTFDDFERLLVEEIDSPGDIAQFLGEVVHGHGNILRYLKNGLASIGIAIQSDKSDSILTTAYGVKLGTSGEVIDVHPESSAYRQVMIQDFIQSFDLCKRGEPTQGVVLEVLRSGRKLNLILEPDGGEYFPAFKLEIINRNQKQLKWSGGESQPS